jgi:hypothetical protein
MWIWFSKLVGFLSFAFATHIEEEESSDEWKTT